MRWALADVREGRFPEGRIDPDLRWKIRCERGAEVSVATVPLDDGGLGLWVTADGRLAATAEVRPRR